MYTFTNVQLVTWKLCTCTYTDLMYHVIFFSVSNLACNNNLFYFYYLEKRLEETVMMKDSMIKQMSAELDELKNRKGKYIVTLTLSPESQSHLWKDC